jgi:hypothetical protein
MAQETFTLSWILPYVREALKQTSNLEFREGTSQRRRAIFTWLLLGWTDLPIRCDASQSTGSDV